MPGLCAGAMLVTHVRGEGGGGGESSRSMMLVLVLVCSGAPTHRRGVEHTSGHSRAGQHI